MVDHFLMEKNRWLKASDDLWPWLDSLQFFFDSAKTFLILRRRVLFRFFPRRELLMVPWLILSSFFPQSELIESIEILHIERECPASPIAYMVRQMSADVFP